MEIYIHDSNNIERHKNPKFEELRTKFKSKTWIDLNEEWKWILTWMFKFNWNPKTNINPKLLEARERYNRILNQNHSQI